MTLLLDDDLLVGKWNWDKKQVVLLVIHTVPMLCYQF